MNHIFHNDDIMHISSIDLTVKNLDQALSFYQDVLGLSLFKKDKGTAEIGTHLSKKLITLHEIKHAKNHVKTLGLYHFALLLSHIDELAKVYQRLKRNHYPISGMADHGVSYAIYLEDPDGIGIELYVDKDPSLWPIVDGKLQMFTEPLDIGILMIQSLDKNIDEHTIIGHLHFHVDDLKDAIDFYVDTLGFETTQYFHQSALFVSSGNYHHHLGLNTWQHHAIPKKTDETGLKGYTITIPHNQYTILKEKLNIKDKLSYIDPLNQEIYFTVK